MGPTSAAENKNAPGDNPSGGLQLRLHQRNSSGSNSFGAFAKNKRQSCCDTSVPAPKSVASKRGSSLPRWMFECYFSMIFWLDTSSILHTEISAQARPSATAAVCHHWTSWYATTLRNRAKPDTRAREIQKTRFGGWKTCKSERDIQRISLLVNCKIWLNFSSSLIMCYEVINT